MSQLVRIVSDGMPNNTKVLTEAGDSIRLIRSISIDMNPRVPVVARIKILEPQVSIKAEPRFFSHHPISGELIEIAGYVLPDGEILKFVPGKP